MLLQQKGFKANSRGLTEYLAGMYDKAQNLVNQRAYQYGGQVGGFDDRSTKLFDSAVKRSASTDPKSPELQRYLDNVIETRGKPTMVFHAADPLVGYQEGGKRPPEDDNIDRGGATLPDIINKLDNKGNEPETPTTINPFLLEE